MKAAKIWVAILTVPLVAGCVTETVSKGPPKIGQTVERPHPAEDTVAADRANQMQQLAVTPQTVVPGDQNAAPAGSSDNSIFESNSSQNVVTNPPQTNQISPASPPNSSGAAATPNSPATDNGQ